MFFGASVFDKPLNKWNVGKVTNMNSMFAHGHFNQDISGWDISNLFWSNHKNDTSGNYKDIFIGCQVTKGDLTINNSIWTGWSEKISGFPDIRSALLYTGLKEP